ncbi:MAG: flippase-like domain-containing protein [Bacteroidales bacterium]|nr:flippase-like domain-containing protein [Bacteroidales bacterium]
MARAREVLKYTLSFALAGVLVWFAFRSVDWTAFWEGLKVTRWGYLIPFFAASVGALVFRVFRWRALLKSSGHRSGWLTVWDANNVGNLSNIVVPGSGEFVRCGYAAGKNGFADVFGTVVMERAWDVLAVLVMIVLALVLDRDKFGPFFAEQVWAPLSGRLNLSLGWLLAVLVLLVAAGLWAVFRFRDRSRLCGRIAGGLVSVGNGFASFRKVERKGLFLLYTLGIWFMYLLMCYSIQRAIPELSGLGLEDALFFTAVGNIASVIPVPGGIGAYHYLVALSVSSIYGRSWETGILFATLQHELHAVLILILGVVSYVALTLRSRNHRA